MASAMLIVIFSTLLYHYIKITTLENVVQNLIIRAEKVSKFEKLTPEILNVNYPNFKDEVYEFEILNEKISKPKFEKSMVKNRSFITLFYPYDSQMSILVRSDITIYENIVSQILADIIILNTTMIFLIIFYAMFLSRYLLLVVKMVSNKLTKVDEKYLKPIEKDEIPLEFEPILQSINRLIERIQTFVLYQKELFIGIAHELKTPLAVMKSKNDVTLIKTREAERYIEALRNNNESIDNMNKMISSILQVGRQEGAQFEEPENRDIVAFLNELCLNFKILAKLENKEIVSNLASNELFMTIRPNLFLHIIQNFVQNAIKFSKENSAILINSRVENEKFIVEILNEGELLDEKIDYFAPFKRVGNKSGAGLGLFLAKGAAQAMNAKISLKNRTDGILGVIAKIEISLNR